MNIPDGPLRDQLEFADTDVLLRDDVRRLGTLVGEVLAEQGSPSLLDEVESIRRAAIARREQGLPVDALAEEMGRVPVADAELVVRAFSTYFGAINLAERVHRIRRRRDYERITELPQPGGFEAVLRGLREEGVSFEELEATLPRLWVEPVFTAHPTEAVRRVMLEKEREIVERLVEDIDRTRTPVERRVGLERIRLSLTAGWQTSDTPAHKPTVADEVEHVGYYLASMLYRVVPVFYEAFADAVEVVYGRRIELPQVLRFGSWVGGDMDGNPNVNAGTIRAALDAQRAQAITQYRADLRTLGNILTQSLGRVGVDDAVIARTDAYIELLPQAAKRLRPRMADMPYRRLMDMMKARLALTAEGDERGYAGAREFISDLELIDASLVNHRGEHAGRFTLQRVLWRARTFGFHLAALDLRQDSAAHDAALADLLGDEDWAARDAADRGSRLQALLDQPPAAPDAPGDVLGSTLDVFRTVLDLRRSHGIDAIGLRWPSWMEDRYSPVGPAARTSSETPSANFSKFF